MSVVLSSVAVVRPQPPPSVSHYITLVTHTMHPTSIRVLPVVLRQVSGLDVPLVLLNLILRNAPSLLDCAK